MKTALILGIGGQDGSYLAEMLLGRGYVVHGFYRRSSVDNLWRIEGVRDRVRLHLGNMADPHSLWSVINTVQPDELYNEADQDDVRVSFESPLESFDVTARAVVVMLEAVKALTKKCRVFQPLSSTMFAPSQHPLNEQSALEPRSPYAIAKMAAWHTCKMYRERGVDVRCGIMFNHDSVRRGPGYLLQKIARGAVAGEIKLWGSGLTGVDVGHAPEFMEAAWRIMQLRDPDDFVVGTGIGFKIQDLCLRAFKAAGLEDGKGIVKMSGSSMLPAIADCRKLAQAVGLDNVPRSNALDVLEMLVKHCGQSGVWDKDRYAGMAKLSKEKQT